MKTTTSIRIACSAFIRPWTTQRKACTAPWEHWKAEQNQDLQHERRRREYRLGYLTSQGSASGLNICGLHQKWQQSAVESERKQKLIIVDLGIGTTDTVSREFPHDRNDSWTNCPSHGKKEQASQRKCHTLLKPQGLELTHYTLLANTMVKPQTNGWRIFSSTLLVAITKCKLKLGGCWCNFPH